MPSTKYIMTQFHHLNSNSSSWNIIEVYHLGENSRIKNNEFSFFSLAYNWLKSQSKFLKLWVSYFHKGLTYGSLPEAVKNDKPLKIIEVKTGTFFYRLKNKSPRFLLQRIISDKFHME